MMAVGAALLCAACARSGVVPYGAVIFPDAGTETVDAGAEMDDASDAGGDGDK
jgi:hypothetical protein